MRTVIFGALAYATVFASVSAVLALIGVAEHLSGGSGAADNWYIGAMIALGVGICSSIAFAFVIASSPAWRRRSVRFVVMVGVAMAMLAFVFQFFGVGAPLSAILIPTSIIRHAPKLSGFLAFAVPGALGGLVGIYVARRNERRAATVARQEESLRIKLLQEKGE